MKPKSIRLTADLTPDISGLSAVFTLIKPKGSDTRTATTDARGIATVQFSLGAKYAHGTYTGKVEIVVNGTKISDSQSIVI